MIDNDAGENTGVVTPTCRICKEPIKYWGSNLRLTLVEKCQRSNVDLTLNFSKRETVQVLNDRVRSTGAQKGLLFSTSNFQKRALEYAKKHGIALIQVAEGKTSYETRGMGVTGDPPPWANIPPHIGYRIQLTESNAVSVSLISRELTDYLDGFLDEQ
jgi:hypothetical protein